MNGDCVGRGNKGSLVRYRALVGVILAHLQKHIKHQLIPSVLCEGMRVMREPIINDRYDLFKIAVVIS